MKQCPQCRATYNDETLRFCLEDGSPLTTIAGSQPEPETVVSYNPARQVIEIPQDRSTNPSFSSPPSYQIPPQPTAKGGSGVLKIVAIVAVFLLLIPVIAGVGGYIVYRSMGSEQDPGNVVSNTNSATPTPSKTSNPGARQTPTTTPKWNESPTPAANKPANGPSPTPVPTPDGAKVSAHSPGDGYLVLRSQPSSSSTEMTRIPHGAKLILLSCKEYVNTPAGNYGRWCTASYKGMTGWVFDAFVKY